MRVLIVDDDEDILVMLTELVETFGYRTTTARNAAQALRAARDFAPHVVLLDIGMPGISGETVLERLHASDPAPPVIMVTANYDEALGKRLLARGAFDYVLKPIDADYLERVIATAMATAPGIEK